jgi:hypothetical protein
MSHDTLRGPERSLARSRVPALRPTAVATGSVSVFAAVALALLYAGVDVFGGANDVANAVVGWLTLVLATIVHRAVGDSRLGFLPVACAAAGALLMTWGSWLVLTETTGYYLAGLVSALGVAAAGSWLLLAVAALERGGLLSRGAARLGRVAGAVMCLGVLALPGAVAGVDDIGTAPWHALVSGVAWLGLYLLYPWWCLRLTAGRA